MKKGIIFDMDGTLWDSAAEVAAANMNERVKKIFMVSGLQKLIRIDTV